MTANSDVSHLTQAQLQQLEDVPEGASPLHQVLSMREDWRRDGARLVWTNGCFDVLHPGHVMFLTTARALGDVLVVGVNDDESVRRLKGRTGSVRPFVPLAGRVAMLAGLRHVDHVLVLSGDAPVHEIGLLRPDVCCKDSDYATRPLPERPVVEAYGGRMALLPRDSTWSTTAFTQHVAEQVAAGACRGACR